MLFVFDPERMRRTSARDVRMLHAAVEALRGDVASKYPGTALRVSVGDTAEVLAAVVGEAKADVVVAHTDPTAAPLDARIESALATTPFAWWSDGLGPMQRATLVPHGADYKRFKAQEGGRRADVAAPAPAPEALPSSSPNASSAPVALADVLAAWRAARERMPDVDDTEGDEAWLPDPERGAGEAHARSLLGDAVALSESEFRESHLPLRQQTSDAFNEHVAMARVVSAKALNRAEALTRVLQPQLSLGCLSAREAIAALRKPIDDEAVPLLGWDERLATLDAALVQLEANEWHRKLAWHDLAVQSDEKGVAKVTYHYWRWHGFLVRYASIDAGASGDEPPLVCVHGFGASAAQWDDLMEELAERGRNSFAVDLLGFGHAQKPPISYTQYLWQQLVVDFVRQVVGRPSFLAGNSIGGYTAMSAAAQLGSDTCVGLVLLNSAGRMVTREEEAAERRERGGRTLAQAMVEDGASALKPLSPPPSWLLTLVGKGLFAYLQPNIASICRQVYPNVPERVEASLTDNILRDSNDPGAVNVLCSGAKLPTPISKNELLEAYGGRVFVLTGMNDPLGNGQAARRFELYEEVYNAQSAAPHRPSGTLTRQALAAGHCPFDERPAECAAAIAAFMVS